MTAKLLLRHMLMTVTPDNAHLLASMLNTLIYRLRQDPTIGFDEAMLDLFTKYIANTDKPLNER